MASNSVDTPQENGQRKRNTQPVLESNPRVKIADLAPRNNNQTFVGKVVELEVVTKGENKTSNKPRNFLKGLIGDETGVIRFDLAERENQPFKIGDIVLFDKAMNKVTKESHHYVEVKRLGSYEVLTGHANINVNSAVNKSDEIVPPPAEGEVRPPRVRQPRENNNKGNRNNASNSQVHNNNNNNNNNNRQNNNNRNNNNNNNNSRLNNNNNNNNSYNNNNRNNNNNNRNNQRQQVNNKPVRPTFVRASLIETLVPGSSEQVVLGQVVEISNFSKTIREKEVNFVKGRIADQTGSINFDLKLFKPISLNDVIVLTNVINRVDNNGFHFVTIGKFGYYTVLSSSRLDTSQKGDLSQIEYVKKAV